MLLQAFDTIATAFSLYLASLARLESNNFLFEKDFYIGLGIIWITTWTTFASRNFYAIKTRHITSKSAATIILGSVTSATVLFAINELYQIKIPLSVPLIYLVFSAVFMLGARFFVRVMAQNMNVKNRVNLAVYGAGDAGRQLTEALKWNPRYKLRMLIDDDPLKIGQIIAGVRVVDFFTARQSFAGLNIRFLLLAMPSVANTAYPRIFDAMLGMTDIKVKSIPDLSDLISGQTGILEIRDVEVNDLLGRKPVDPDPELMKQNIEGKVVLVTGGGGSIGSELCRQTIKLKPKAIIILDVSEYSIYKIISELDQIHHDCELIGLVGSIQDKQYLEKTFSIQKIDTVFHAAAYKHVPLMEKNITQCYKNNVQGTINVCEAALAAKVKNFTLISTDKAVNPPNVMGASKRIAELVCLSLARNASETKISIVRFGNVLGSSGSVVPLFEKQIKTGGPVTVTHREATRYFMTIKEAAELLIQTTALAKGGETFVLNMGQPVKIFDLAQKMIAIHRNKLEFGANNALSENIRIECIGLRLGEKLHEELSHTKKLLDTAHKLIMKTETHSVDHEKLNKDLELLLQASNKNDELAMAKILIEMGNKAY